MTKKSKKVVDIVNVRTLNPRDADTKYYGDEPLFATQPEPELRRVAMTNAMNWYGHFYTRKDAKDLFVQYLEHIDNKDDMKAVKKAEDREFNMSWCWVARMKMRGLKLTEQEEKTLTDEVARLKKSVTDPDVEVSATGKKSNKKTDEAAPSNRPGVQEIMRERAREACGEIEGVFDEYITAGCPSKFTINAREELNKRNILPQHINMLNESWKSKIDEFNETLKGKDSQLVEGYRNFTKPQIKNAIKFCEQVLSELGSYVSIKKATKAPRKRKAVPVEKIVSKLKYLKEFKDSSLKLDLVSISPTKLHGSSEAWVYDSAKRKLHHYVADEYSKSLTVKGNTLLGFDATKSQIKTLRKPNEQIKEIMGSKPAARKFFDSIKAVAVKPNGRFNNNMVILKAF